MSPLCELTAILPCIRWPWVRSTSGLLIWGVEEFLATSDDRTQCVAGLPGDVVYDGGCHVSFGTYKGKTSWN